MTNLCYFKFFEFCENRGCQLVSHEKTFASVCIIKDGKSVPVPINSPFDNYDEALKLISETFKFDIKEILKYSKKERQPPDEKITKYEKIFPKITSFHSHCY